jgi:uncharacterized membrane protein
MKHLQHITKTPATHETDACNMHFQAQHLLVAYEMEAHQRMELTRGNRVVATIDQTTDGQIDSANHKADRDPFVAASILCSMQDA